MVHPGDVIFATVSVRRHMHNASYLSGVLAILVGGISYWVRVRTEDADSQRQSVRVELARERDEEFANNESKL